MASFSLNHKSTSGTYFKLESQGHCVTDYECCCFSQDCVSEALKNEASRQEYGATSKAPLMSEKRKLLTIRRGSKRGCQCLSGVYIASREEGFPPSLDQIEN